MEEVEVGFVFQSGVSGTLGTVFSCACAGGFFFFLAALFRRLWSFSLVRTS